MKIKMSSEIYTDGRFSEGVYEQEGKEPQIVLFRTDKVALVKGKLYFDTPNGPGIFDPEDKSVELLDRFAVPDQLVAHSSKHTGHGEAYYAIYTRGCIPYSVCVINIWGASFLFNNKGGTMLSFPAFKEYAERLGITIHYPYEKP